ncbi:hypothetical protein [Microvirga aerophila]|uniref:Uncharacterized protein n=1 Tax=Microvirga aerophila TaxID=670291 RepID=A0A512C0P8_9HYPH|nr:hypothetical protein [Microvirga aerophila]GEO17788.1 hypothetical protein MAE02_54840 [Microvirga aerophila]
MTRLKYSFDAAKEIAKQAGLSGLWQHQLSGCWTLAVEKDAGLRWSPTQAELSFYGPQTVVARMRAAVEGALKRNLIASSEDTGTEEIALELIKTDKELLKWLVRYMRRGTECPYPIALVACAERLVREFLNNPDDDVPMFQMWGNPVLQAESFASMTSSCPTRPYSAMLMDWAGRLHAHLTIGDLEKELAVCMAIGAARLGHQFREKNLKDAVVLRSRLAFEKQFGLRVRIRHGDEWLRIWAQAPSLPPECGS